MTNSEILTALSTALLLGILIGWLWRRLGEKRRAARLTAAGAPSQVAELEGRVARLRAELADAQNGVDTEHAQLEDRARRCADEVAELHQLLHARDEEITHLHTELVRRKAQPPPSAAAPSSAPPAAAPSVPEQDDLKAIFGIGPVLERLLNGAGIATYRQIAGWTAADIEDITGKLSVFPDRIQRDNWVQGAKDEHFRKYGERV